MKLSPPKGWYVAPGPQTGEDDYHSKEVDPSSKFGAVDSSTPNHASYKAESPYTPEGTDPRTTAQPPLEENETVVESHILNDREYFLVYNVETEKFHVFIADVEPGQSYTSPKKGTRSEALEQAYKVLNSKLPTCAMAQLTRRSPESLIS